MRYIWTKSTKNISKLGAMEFCCLTWFLLSKTSQTFPHEILLLVSEGPTNHSIISTEVNNSLTLTYSLNKLESSRVSKSQSELVWFFQGLFELIESLKKIIIFYVTTLGCRALLYHQKRVLWCRLQQPYFTFLGQEVDDATALTQIICKTKTLK